MNPNSKSTVDIVAVRSWDGSASSTWDFRDLPTSKVTAGNSMSAGETVSKIKAAKSAPAKDRAEKRPMATNTTENDPSGNGLPRPESPGRKAQAGEQSRERVNWLKDDSMLPKAIPEARVIWFEYPSVSSLGLDSLATELLRCLRAMRTGSSDPPIVFVGHGTGGNIIQKALVAEPADAVSIFHSTAGIVFLASPFIASGIPSDQATSRAIWDLLGPHRIKPASRRSSGTTSPPFNLLPVFAQRVKGEGIPLVWFYEEQHPKVYFLIERRMVIYWETAYAETDCEKATSTSETEEAIKDFQRFPLGKGWSGMGGFPGPDDPDYQRVRDFVKLFVINRQFIDAAANDDTICVHSLLSEGVARDLQNSPGQRALYKAVENGHLRMARLLLAQGAASIGYKYIKERTVLHLAVAQAVRAHAHKKSKEKTNLPTSNAREIEMVQFLLEKGADIETRDAEGKSARDLANEEKALIPLFKYRLLQTGPSSILEPPQWKKPNPPKSREEITACKGFLATLAEFYILEGKENRVLERASVYEVLYKGGPQAILDDVRHPDVTEEPKCCWYHLPANNVGHSTPITDAISNQCTTRCHGLGYVFDPARCQRR
jgi:hypothetical protein